MVRSFTHLAYLARRCSGHKTQHEEIREIEREAENSELPPHRVAELLAEVIPTQRVPEFLLRADREVAGVHGQTIWARLRREFPIFKKKWPLDTDALLRIAGQVAETKPDLYGTNRKYYRKTC